MKIAMFFISSLIILTSCDDGAEQRKKDQDKSMAQMNSFVDSVQNAVANNENVDWDEVDRRFERLDDDVEKSFENTTDEVKRDAEMVEDKYEAIKTDYKVKRDDFNRKADAQVAEVESWFDRTTENVGDGVDEAGEDIEDGYRNSMNWLEENYDNLEDNTQQKYNELKQKFEKSDA